RSTRDWSSDVCSSDLEAEGGEKRGDDQRGDERREAALYGWIGEHFLHGVSSGGTIPERSSVCRAVIPSEPYRKTTGAPRASRTPARDWRDSSSSPSWDSGNRASPGRRRP